MRNDIYQHNNKQWLLKHDPKWLIPIQSNNRYSKWKYKAKFIDYLVRRIDIVDLIEEIWMPSFRETKSIAHWSISPFSSERSRGGRPFGASRKKRIFKCYDTGNSGGIIKFVQLLFGYNKKQAITYLVTRYKIDSSKAILETKMEDIDDDLPF